MSQDRCYPFIYEDGFLCDYEIETDRLCSQLGFVCELLPQPNAFAADLRVLQELIYHQNGSLRGKCAVQEEHVQWLRAWYTRLLESRDSQGKTTRGNGVFVLPAGTTAAAALHIARCQAKAVVRIMGKCVNQGIAVPAHLLDWANLVANHLFLLAEAVNLEAGRPEIPFVTRSYGQGISPDAPALPGPGGIGAHLVGAD